MRALRWWLLAVGVAWVTAAEWVSVHYGALDVTHAVIEGVADGAAIPVGLLVWARRPANPIGPLMVLFGFTVFISNLRVIPADLPFTVGYFWVALPTAFSVHFILAYPSGRLRSAIDRFAVGYLYVVLPSLAAAQLMVFDPGKEGCDGCPHSLIEVHGSVGAANVLQRLAAWLTISYVAFYVGLLVRKIVRATPPARRVIAPLLAFSAFGAVRVAGQQILGLVSDGSPLVGVFSFVNLFWLEKLTNLLIPTAFLLGLVWTRWSQTALGPFMLELRDAPPGGLRGALARALGDPSLALAYRLPGGGWVDGAGAAVALPPPGAGRAVTPIGTPAEPVAAIVHDPALLETPMLVEAAGAAAGMALENERLQAELRAQLAELRASRARLVQAGDDERRRLERDLHDGAQQRLLAMGLALQLAQSRLGPEANGAGTLLTEAEAELRAALGELRELARGIHPAVLTDQGLGPAIRALADRTPVAVEIAELPAQRLPAATEAAIYFVVAEALTNAAKHARGATVTVAVGRHDGVLRADISDDGPGGADAARGSGLRGLVDRIEAIGGELAITSVPGAGTTIRAVAPCA